MKSSIFILLAIVSVGLSQSPGGAYLEDRLLIHLNQKAFSIEDIEHIPAIRSIRPAFPGLDMEHILELQLAQPTDPFLLKAQLEKLAAIRLAEPIPWVYSSYVPNDFDSARDYHLTRLRATQAWDSTRGSAEVVIAIVDNGILLSHEELQQPLWQNPYEIQGDGIDNDGNGWVDDYRGRDVADGDNDPTISNRVFRHGTHIAGLIVASADNGAGSVGLAHGCRILPVKVGSSNGFADSYPLSDALRGVAYAVASGADVICMAWGGTDSLLAAHLLMDRAHERGIILVAAAGNGPGDTNPFTNDSTLEYPASYQSVVSVTATDEDDKRAFVATANRRVALCAPGELIYGPVPSAGLNSSYMRMRGSSQATAIPSAAFGLLLSKRPCLSPDEAIAIIQQSCVNIDAQNPGLEGKLGAGRIDMHAALQALGAVPEGLPDFVVLDSSSCSGILRLQYSAQGCPDSLRWQGPGGQEAEGRSPRFAVDSSGSYTFCLKVWQHGRIDSICKQQQVNIYNRLRISPGDTSIASGDSLRLKAEGPAGLYIWEPAEAFPGLPIGTQRWYHPVDSSWVYLTAYGADGCRLEDSVFVGLLPPTGLEEALEKTISVYPNPAQKGFSVTLPKGLRVEQLALLDFLGRTVFEYEALPSGEHIYLLPTLTNGSYLLRIQTNQGLVLKKLNVVY
jgi:subtilisin family serine protease